MRTGNINERKREKKGRAGDSGSVLAFQIKRDIYYFTGVESSENHTVDDYKLHTLI